MVSLIIGVLGVLMAATSPGAGTNQLTRSPRVAAAAPDPNDPVEKEFQNLMEQDDAAQEEVDRWIQENEKFAAAGAGLPAEQLQRRIRDRFDKVTKAYEDFIKRHPKHARARVAYASLLGDIKDEESSQEQLEQALMIETNDPAIYNNLANIYGHIGPVKKAFEFYARAIQLNPLEPVYYHNLGTTVFLFRTDAKEYYHINEQQVFGKALDLYSNAMRLDPQNFPLASDVAQTYYGIEPMRTDEALKAWTNALRIASDEVEREGVYVHYARIKLHAGRYAEAHAHLRMVTNAVYGDLKKRLERNLREREFPGTNSPANK